MEDSDLLKDRIKLLEQQLENVRKKSQMYSLPKTPPTYTPEPKASAFQNREFPTAETIKNPKPKLDFNDVSLTILPNSYEHTEIASPQHIRSLQNLPSVGAAPPNLMPMYPVYYQNSESLLIKQQLESLQSQMLAQNQGIENRHREELDKLRRDFEEMIKRKDNEIKKLQRVPLDEHTEYDLMEKLRQISREKEILENKTGYLEEQLTNIRRNYEQLKTVAQTFKTNLEEQEKQFRNIVKDLEKETRSIKDKLDEKSEESKRDKEKSENLQGKVIKLKDKTAQQSREILRIEERNTRLEKEIEDLKVRSHENRAIEENEAIKRQLNFMMQSIERLQNGYTRTAVENKEIDDLRRQLKNTRTELNSMKVSSSGYESFKDLKPTVSCTEPSSPIPKQISEPYSAKRKALLDLTRSLDGALNWENLEQVKSQDLPVMTFPSNESYERNKDVILRLESTLSGLQIEKQRLENELNKIPEQTRTLNIKKRRNELEMQLAMVEQNITSLKSKLRRLNS